VAAQARGTFPGMDKLPLLSAGALVSLVYNRGPSTVGPSRLEMREIRSALGSGDVAEIPGYIRAMVRLWPNSRDLQDRRRKEADLFEQGLTEAR
jgi:GH24 family phage-related lysozyme (muramidase)